MHALRTVDLRGRQLSISSQLQVWNRKKAPATSREQGVGADRTDMYSCRSLTRYLVTCVSPGAGVRLGVENSSDSSKTRALPMTDVRGQKKK